MGCVFSTRQLAFAIPGPWAIWKRAPCMRTCMCVYLRSLFTQPPRTGVVTSVLFKTPPPSILTTPCMQTLNQSPSFLFSHVPLLSAPFLLHVSSTSLPAWTFRCPPNCSLRQSEPHPSCSPLPSEGLAPALDENLTLPIMTCALVICLRDLVNSSIGL